MPTQPPPDEPKPQPRHKDKMIGIRVPPDIADKAKERAEGEGRKLFEVLRTWLTGFAEHEFPMPPEPEDGMEGRAPQRPESKPRKPRSKAKPAKRSKRP